LGRYLYSLEPQWVDYDPDKRQLILDPKPPRSPAPQRSYGPPRAEAPKGARAPRTTKGPQRVDREMALQALEQELGLQRAAVLGAAKEAAELGGEPIGPKRAGGMHRALLSCGVNRREHEAFASEVVGREVSDLADLTDAEARRVWAEARARREEMPAAAWARLRREAGRAVGHEPRGPRSRARALSSFRSRRREPGRGGAPPRSRRRSGREPRRTRRRRVSSGHEPHPPPGTRSRDTRPLVSSV